MNDPEHDDPLLRRARHELRASEHDLDELTLARLGRARARAIEAAARGKRYRWWRAAPLAAAAALALALGLAWLQPPPDSPAPLLEDLRLLSSGADLEMLEDLDFYLWLEYAQPDRG